jgi:ssRNA-specific RNase YbeY (16S rRNA maturation enzyme)
MKVFNNVLSSISLDILLYIQSNQDDKTKLQEISDCANITIIDKNSFTFEFKTDENKEIQIKLTDVFVYHTLNYKEIKESNYTNILNFGACYGEGRSLDIKFLNESFIRNLEDIRNNIEINLYPLKAA